MRLTHKADHIAHHALSYAPSNSFPNLRSLLIFPFGEWCEMQTEIAGLEQKVRPQPRSGAVNGMRCRSGWGRPDGKLDA